MAASRGRPLPWDLAQALPLPLPLGTLSNLYKSLQLCGSCSSSTHRGWGSLLADHCRLAQGLSPSNCLPASGRCRLNQVTPTLAQGPASLLSEQRLSASKTCLQTKLVSLGWKKACSAVLLRGERARS